MSNDPIVAEVRRIRSELAREFDYDVVAIFADMRKRQVQFGNRLIQQSASKVPNMAVKTSGESGGR